VSVETRSRVLVAEGLEKVFVRGSEHVRALVGVSFSLRAGEVVGLTGPSGSGKTTLLNVLCGWERADAGTIALPSAAPALAAQERHWRDVSILPQDLALFDELPIGENVRLPLRLSKADGAVASDAAGLIDELGLTDVEARFPREAALGEQQRAALARALVLRPRLLLADEPTAHQDEGWTKAVMAAIRSSASGGTACLVATHDPDALPFLDRVLTMRDGRLSDA
jgi:putative ABC transport system ATP-binding protein